jgi:DHA2 family integral membrane protein (MFS transporter)
VLGSILNTAYRTGVEQHTATLPAGLADRARGGERLGTPDLVAHANSAFVHGISLALVTGAAVLIGGAVFVAVRAPGRAESEANANSALPTAGLVPAQTT